MYDDDAPELSTADAEKLAIAGPWGDGMFASINPAAIEYGATWANIIDSASNMNDMLEAAAAAGRLGFCDTGIALALRAAHLFAIYEALAWDAEQVDVACLDADIFRRFSMLCEDIVADLEDRTASIHFDAADSGRRSWNIRRRRSETQRDRNVRRRLGEAATSRAANARKRRRTAAADTRHHRAELSWLCVDATNAAGRRP